MTSRDSLILSFQHENRRAADRLYRKLPRFRDIRKSDLRSVGWIGLILSVNSGKLREDNRGMAFTVSYRWIVEWLRYQFDEPCTASMPGSPSSPAAMLNARMHSKMRRSCPEPSRAENDSKLERKDLFSFLARSLPVRLRAVFSGYYLHGKSLREIGRSMKVLNRDGTESDKIGVKESRVCQCRQEVVDCLRASFGRERLLEMLT
jgi:hypothetical protein